MEELKTYQGSCHCGRVRFEAVLDLGGQFIACNCSMCGRAGTLLTFIPADHFRLLSGDDTLTDYQFNKKKIHHLFCSTCGIKAFAKGKGPGGAEMRAINARCLDGVDVGKLSIKHFDGKSA
jgi:hypothetical protein